MAESELQAEDNKASASDPVATGGGEPSSPSYPYLQLLRELQSKAIRAQDPSSAPPEGKSEPPPDSARRASWDLCADALLATTLREFTSHVARRTHRAASEIRGLQGAVNRTGVDVAVCQTEFMRRSEDIFMEQVVGDDESGSESTEDGGNDDGKADGKIEGQNSGDDDDDSDSSADIARLEAEEKAAIAAGMKALDLFFDPRRPTKSSEGGGDGNGGTGDQGDAMIDAEEDIIGENCYYYPSVEQDEFNQRPLPFIVGSREFMESSCAGLGGEDGENGN
ncbi:hypothetical protein ACHAWF_002255 [Thalassiosira exigua]